jgi:hypothetical protein
VTDERTVKPDICSNCLLIKSISPVSLSPTKQHVSCGQVLNDKSQAEGCTCQVPLQLQSHNKRQHTHAACQIEYAQRDLLTNYQCFYV